MVAKATTSIAALAKYNTPTLPQLDGGQPIFWRNELQKISKSINLLVANGPGITQVGDANYTIQTTDRTINGVTTFTAPRTWTLPPVSSVLPGQQLMLLSIPGSVAGPFTLITQGTDVFFPIDITGSSSVAVIGPFNADVSILLIACPDTNGAFWCYKVLGNATQPASPPSAPQGRLTLVTGTPVDEGNHTSATTIYYTAFLGQYVPLWNGNGYVMTAMGGDLSNVTTDSTHNPAAVVANSLYDLFIWNNNGVPTLSRGPAWTNSNTRSLALVYQNGFLVNQAAITNGPSTGYGTYVGTMFIDATLGITQVTGTGGTGGAACFAPIWNMYNRINFRFTSQDTGAAYTYTSSVVRTVRGSQLMGLWAVCGAFGSGEDTFIIDRKYSVGLVAVSGAQIRVGTGGQGGVTAFAAFGYDTIQSQAAVAMGHAGTVHVQLASVSGLNSAWALEEGDNVNANTFNADGNDMMCITWRW